MKTMCVPLVACKNCGYEFDRISDVVADNVPRPGDMTLCLRCGDIMAFNDDMTLRSLTEDDISCIPLATLSRLQRVRLEIQRRMAQGAEHSGKQR